jgi:hypothetical protein
MTFVLYEADWPDKIQRILLGDAVLWMAPEEDQPPPDEEDED